MAHFEKTSELVDPASVVYAWHERPGSFFRLIPPWESVTVVVPPKTIENDSEVVTEVKIGPLKVQWVARHFGVERGKIFCDDMIEGPFSTWTHRHVFSPSEHGSKMTDSIDYEFPLGRLGEAVSGSYTEEKLEKLFSYRHTVLKNDLELDKKYSHKKKKILITGGTGLVGSSLIPLLQNLGHEIITLSREDWPIDFKKKSIQSVDVVIHLAGENIAASRWTKSRKEKILKSRVETTRALAQAIAELPSKPSTFICASASGFYPESPSQLFDEEAPAGDSFLSDVCQKWEEACAPAKAKGIRTLHLRFGIILTPKDGALKKMLLPFRMGVGGPLGTGKQLWSWISIDDLLNSIVHCMETESLSGPVNISAPNPLTNKEFSKVLAASLQHKMGPSVPAFALKMAMGEMADELLLASRGMVPKKLLDSKFQFNFPELKQSLSHLLGVK